MFDNPKKRQAQGGVFIPSCLNALDFNKIGQPMLASVCVAVCAHLDCNQGLDRFAQSFPLYASFPLQGSYTRMAEATHVRVHILLTPNIISSFTVPKSAGVFPLGASKRQSLRDQRLLCLCSSAQLLSTLMQMCARQSGSGGRRAGIHAVSG